MRPSLYSMYYSIRVLDCRDHWSALWIALNVYCDSAR